jgi:hypothetical protein
MVAARYGPPPRRWRTSTLRTANDSSSSVEVLVMNLDQVLLFELLDQPPGLASVALLRALPPDAVDNLFKWLVPGWNPFNQTDDLDSPGDHQRVGELSIAEGIERQFEFRPAVVRRNRPELLELGPGESRLRLQIGARTCPVDDPLCATHQPCRAGSVIREKNLLESDLRRHAILFLFELVLLPKLLLGNLYRPNLPLDSTLEQHRTPISFAQSLDCQTGVRQSLFKGRVVLQVALLPETLDRLIDRRILDDYPFLRCAFHQHQLADHFVEQRLGEFPKLLVIRSSRHLGKLLTDSVGEIGDGDDLFVHSDQDSFDDHPVRSSN